MKNNIVTLSFLADMIVLSNNEHNTALHEFLIELQSIYDSKDPNHLEKVLKFETSGVTQRNIQVMKILCSFPCFWDADTYY